MLAWRLARRELRGGVRGLRIVIACLALGVGVIAAVGTLREGIDRGLAADGRRILGGDLEIQGGSQPLPDTLRDWLRGRGARISDVVEMRAMLVAGSGERELVELKAVDPAWPLVGAAAFDPPQQVAAALAERDGTAGVAVERVVMDRLALKPGDMVRLGTARLRVAGVLAEEPDRVATAAMFGARALLAAAALPATGLLQPGTIAEYAVRVVLPPGEAPQAAADAVRAAFPGQGWRIRDAAHAAPGVDRFIEQTSLFMTLVGLTSLLVGGIGVATGVRAWLDARSRTIATLRCLGASGGLVFQVCLIQVLTLAALGVAIGLVVGTALPLAASGALAGMLPVPPHLGLFPRPLALAAAYGLLTAGSFALWPLGRAMRIPGSTLFRDAIVPTRTWPGRRLLAANGALVAALVALTVLAAPERGFALWFCAAAAATLLLFRAGAALLMLAARAAPRPRSPALRLGLSNLYRPGAATPLMLVAVGLGLSTLAAVALIEGNLRGAILDQLPAQAPSFFFIDIQNDQLAQFKSLLAASPGVQDLHEVPSLRARIVAVKGVPVDRVQATPDTRWALRGDRGLTYAANPPEGTRITAGAWWPADYAGPPLLSFDAGLAAGWGVGVGDIITVNVLGRDIDLRIASLRDIAWRTLSLNFTFVASPGLLEHAPHSHIATVRAAPAEQGALLRRVTDALPNVSAIRVEDVLRGIAELLGKISVALAATGSLTLVAGALVLAGAVASGQRRRIQDAVVLKSLGATRQQIRAAWLVEFGVLGAAAGIIAAAVGTAASFGVVHFVLATDWAFLPATLALTMLGCVAVMLGFGYAATEGALRARPAALLRNP